MASQPAARATRSTSTVARRAACAIAESEVHGRAVEPELESGRLPAGLLGEAPGAVEVAARLVGPPFGFRELGARRQQRDPEPDDGALLSRTPQASESPRRTVEVALPDIQAGELNLAEDQVHPVAVATHRRDGGVHQDARPGELSQGCQKPGLLQVDLRHLLCCAGAGEESSRGAETLERFGGPAERARQQPAHEGAAGRDLAGTDLARQPFDGLDRRDGAERPPPPRGPIARDGGTPMSRALAAGPARPSSIASSRQARASAARPCSQSAAARLSSAKETFMRPLEVAEDPDDLAKPDLRQVRSAAQQVEPAEVADDGRAGVGGRSGARRHQGALEEPVRSGEIVRLRQLDREVIQHAGERRRVARPLELGDRALHLQFRLARFGRASRAGGRAKRESARSARRGRWPRPAPERARRESGPVAERRGARRGSLRRSPPTDRRRRPGSGADGRR